MGCCRSQNSSRYKTTKPEHEPTDIFALSAENTVMSPTLKKRVRRLISSNSFKPSEDCEEAPTAKVTKPDKTEVSRRLINEALKKHFIFSSLTEDNSQTLIEAMKLYRLNAREIIFEQGMPGSNFFIIAAGKVEIVVNRRRVNTLKSGDSFGELALLQSLPRSAAVKTLEPTQLWVIDRVAFNEALKVANSSTYEENKAFINGVAMFQALSQAQKDGLIMSLITQKYNAGEVIVKEGDVGELFYIIKEGTVACIQQGVEVRRLVSGEFFGEQALLYHCTRTATCSAVTPVKCLSITRARLNKALGASLQKIIYKNSLRIAFSRSSNLSKLTPEQQDRVIDRMEVKTYRKHAVVIERGTKMGRKLWVVVKGSLACEGVSSVFAGIYISVGDIEIMSDETSQFKVDIIASEESDIAEITKAELERVIGTNLQTAATANGMVDLLRKVELFQGLSTENLQMLSFHMTLASYRDLQPIFTQGSLDSNFYVIKTGTVDVVKDGARIRSIAMLDYFGERSILSNEPRSASIVAIGPVTCWVLSKESFMKVVSQRIVDYLTSRKELQDEHVTLSQLAPVQTVGRGNFGIVSLVAHRNRPIVYALKSVPRWKVVTHDIFDNVLQEKKVLEVLSHVFILKSVRTFKDPQRIYYLTEFVKGVELFDVLKRIGLVSDEYAKFYVGSLILILEHLHERSIVYRDLKPENLMVDDHGYLKLTDFGSAKILDGRTYTVLGTPHYMAPEVILGKGYDCLADYWSLGVILYEFISGLLPFGDDLRNPYDVYEAILACQLQYPRYVKRPFPSQSLIEQLLSKHPAARVGNSTDTLKSHPWFREFSWDKLINKALPPPYVPEVPDYSAKITAALANPRTIDDFLTSEERSEDKSKLKRRAEPANWDAEF
jgi:cGMP-dependent protein kinase